MKSYIFLIYLYSCTSLDINIKDQLQSPEIPFMKNSPSECYYLDEFMPVADSMVSGKSSNVNIRYYTYKYVNYKNFIRSRIILGFYSYNLECWYLFEEYYNN